MPHWKITEADYSLKMDLTNKEKLQFSKKCLVELIRVGGNKRFLSKGVNVQPDINN